MDAQQTTVEEDERNAYRLELIDDLEHMLTHRRHGLADGHLHGHEIEVREAHRAVQRLRDAVRSGRVTLDAVRHVRRCANALHLARPHGFAETLELLESDVSDASGAARRGR